MVTLADVQQRFLDECLSAIRAQAGVRPVVLVAPWGPGDAPGRADWLPRSASLAAARDLGIGRATTGLVRVVEAADTLPPDSTAALLAALAGAPEAGTVAGTSERIDATWRDRAHAGPPGAGLELGARLLRPPAWRAAGLTFAAGHADHAGHPDATLARADRLLGVVPVPVVAHHDHHREHGLPFGHLPRRAADLDAWLVAVEATLVELLPDRAPAWAAMVLDHRLPDYLADVESFTEKQWHALRETVQRLRATAGDRDVVRVEARVQAWLVAEDRRDDLTALVLRRWRDDDDLPTTVADGAVLVDLAMLGLETDVPADVRRVAERESPLWASLRRATWTDAGLRLELVAVVRGVTSGAGELAVRLRRGDDVLDLVAQARPTPEATRVVGEGWSEHDHGWWEVVVDPATLPPGDGRWDLTLTLHDRGLTRTAPVRHRDLRGSAGHLTTREIAGRTVGPSWHDGALALRVGGRPVAATGPAPRLGRVELAEGALRVLLVGAGDGTLELRPRAGEGDALPAAVPGEGEVTVPLTVDPWALGRRPAPTGSYVVWWRPGRGPARPVGLTDELLGVTPTDAIDAAYRLRVRATHDGQALLELEAPRPDEEIGPFAQRRLQRAYAASRATLDERLVYFQAYTGQHATDSPLAIHRALRARRPDLTLRWCVDDLGVPLPEGAEPVLFRSAAWYDTLATARWVVTNIEMERWFRRRDGQELVQTWHGNPGKVMGLTLWKANGLTPGRIEQTLDHGPRNWTLLVSPSPEMTTHYRREFAYGGPVVEQGYPRDDVLVGPEAGALRTATRDRLGIRPDQTAVLYAPTWRDTMATNYRAARLHPGLDLARLADRLGDDHVVLLRGHRFHRDPDDRTRGARVLDVTGYPEINDLVLAADVAVLDYSSLRFDFGLTGKPMLFLVPDLDEYAGGRGFLYDFRDSAPGPLLASTDAVVERLRDLDAVREEYAAAQAVFRQRFHAGQDGHAADRVVQAFFGSGPA